MPSRNGHSLGGGLLLEALELLAVVVGLLDETTLELAESRFDGTALLEIVADALFRGSTVRVEPTVGGCLGSVETALGNATLDGALTAAGASVVSSDRSTGSDLVNSFGNIPFFSHSSTNRATDICNVLQIYLHAVRKRCNKSINKT